MLAKMSRGPTVLSVWPFLGFQRGNFPSSQGAGEHSHSGPGDSSAAELRVQRRKQNSLPCRPSYRMNEPSETFAGLYQLFLMYFRRCLRPQIEHAGEMKPPPPRPEDAPFGDSTYVKLSSSVCPQPSYGIHSGCREASSRKPGWILCGTLTNFTGERTGKYHKLAWEIGCFFWGHSSQLESS